MKKINYIVLVTLAVASTEILRGQDVHFSQYAQAPLLINPALTGMIDGNHRLICNYKSQWTSVGSPYKTMAFSYDTHILQNRTANGNCIGLGLVVFKDKAGDSQLQQTQLNASLSGIMKIDEKNTLSVGLQLGYAQRSISLTNLKWGNQYDGSQYDPNLPTNEVGSIHSFAYADASAGMAWQYRKNQHSFAEGNSFSKMDAGIAVYHIATPKQKFGDVNEILHRKFVLHASMEFDISNTRLAIVPSIVFIQQGVLKEFLSGAMVKYKIKQRTSRYTGVGKDASFYLGLQMRVKDAIIPCIMYEMGNYAFGISYDFNSSGLNAVSSGKGGYELMLRFNIGKDKAE